MSHMAFSYSELYYSQFSEKFLCIMAGFFCLWVFHSNIWTPASSWFCECLTLASVPNSSSTLNLVLKCFTSRNVFPVCRAVRSLHQQVFTTPANLRSGGESLSFYHKRPGEHFFLLFNFFFFFGGGGGVQIIHLLLNCCDKDQVLCRSYSSGWVGFQGTRADPVAGI